MTFTPKRRLGFSGPATPIPYPTPRSERRPSDLRWTDGGSRSSLSHHDRDKEANVQVIVRCRPLSIEEQKMNVQKAISCNEQKREVTVLQCTSSKQVDRSFSFDKVFGPKAQQRTIYDNAISPVIIDVLEGFNCTVFAYGQTGTGKTYTMEGGLKSVKVGELSPDAGVIPRAVRQIFDTLDAQKADYSVKVTFLELYNEEITDLLVAEDCSRHNEEKRKPISLLEDGKGGAVIRGLEEEIVYGANEIYDLLERGSAKRQDADTLLNKQNSRSHSIFTITIHVKERMFGGEDLIKCGRLNLVDLAGSENIARSGVREVRAREAGELNKSLLTLGRVIIALAEHSNHIPYRDSKLTRLLRESLGGKAKTCFIATVSPSAHCLEETLSTLDYAYRAKSIRNKPEANQKLTKSVLLGDLYLEVERLKQDVKAAREKNGIYITAERYEKDETERKFMSERVERLEHDLKMKTKQAQSFQELYIAEQERNVDLENEVKACKINLENINREFIHLQENYRLSNSMLKEKDYVISRLLGSENVILEHAKALHTDLESASVVVAKLHDKLECKTKIEAENKGLLMSFGSQLNQNLKRLHNSVIGSVSQQQQIIISMEEHASSFIARKCEEHKDLESKIEKIKEQYSVGITAMKNLVCVLQKKSSLRLDELKSIIATQMMAIENFLVTVISEADHILNNIKRSLANQRQVVAFSTKQHEEGLQRTLLCTQLISNTTTDFFRDLYNQACKVMAALDESHKERIQHLEKLKMTFQEASVNEEKAALEKIAQVLATLSRKKTNLILDAIDTMAHTNIERNKELKTDLGEMQYVSSNAQEEWTVHMEEVERQFEQDTFSAAEARITMEDSLQNCSNRVEQSLRQWENVQNSIDTFNRENIAEVDICIENAIEDDHNLLQKFKSLSSSTDADNERGTSDLTNSVNNSLFLDQEEKKEVDSLSAICLDQLKLLQDDHSKKVAEIRDLTEKRILKEYQVDHTTNTTPSKQSVRIPRLSFIEALRTPSLDDLVSKMTSDISLKEEAGKKQQQFSLQDASRSPLSAIN